MWFILGAVIFVAIVAAALFISLSGNGLFSPHHAITGQFQLSDTSANTFLPSITSTGSSCKGSGGFSDIGPGVGVVMKDGSGKLLSTGSLAEGTGTATQCTFAFTLPDVPEVPFYTVEVGRRGSLSYSLSDLKSQGWKLTLTLGSQLLGLKCSVAREAAWDAMRKGPAGRLARRPADLRPRSRPR